MIHQLVVSIINFRTPDLTLGCVRSVLQDVGDLDVSIIIVDNASGDGSDARIADWIATHPEAPVVLIRSASNTGFSGGHNQSFAAAAADHYLVLNSDAILRPGFLQAVLTAADSAPEVGMFAPRIETEEGETQVSAFRFHGPGSELIRGAASAPVSRLLRRHDVPLYPPVPDDEIDWASFACILLRGEMVRQIGPMDEGYFLYFEDAEYCLRARRAGWRIRQVPEAAVVHFRGGSGPVKSLAKERRRLPAYYYASRTRFLYQAHGWSGLLAANLLWSAGRILAWFRPLFGKPVPPVIESEARDIWINFLRPLGPRHGPED